MTASRSSTSLLKGGARPGRRSLERASSVRLHGDRRCGPLLTLNKFLQDKRRAGEFTLQMGEEDCTALSQLRAG